jgi:hypothetical protein
LPFLHILILVYAIPRNAYLVFCAARLFEEVKVVREKFAPTGDWQAITWETQELVVAQKDKALAQIQDLVDDVTTAFVTRYRAYNPLPPEFALPPGGPAGQLRAPRPARQYPSTIRPQQQSVPSPRGGY